MEKGDFDPARVTPLREGAKGGGAVIYWMSRDQRVRDNWALILAGRLARERGRPLAVAFCLAGSFPGARACHYRFMIEGLESVERSLAALEIPFFLLFGEPGEEIPRLARASGAGALVCDFDPLRIKRQWQAQALAATGCDFYEVDAHNIVPCRFASGKAEFAARTIRPKINRLLPRFLTGFPSPPRQPFPWRGGFVRADWAKARALAGADGPGMAQDQPPAGEKAGRERLARFLAGGLERYAQLRNDPVAEAQSGLSPYLHFGQLSAQRAAFETEKAAPDTAAGDVFLEELVVRRELSDNFCFYNENYDSVEGFPGWARKTLDEHRRDRRPYHYRPETLERAETHDEAWNAAQRQVARTGRMHGYMRMYWAKKILEWSPSPEKALRAAIELNDRYELDGRDPNGYAGIAWAIGGLHDRPWFERPVYGKIRYMSEAGCRRKFDLPAWIARYPA